MPISRPQPINAPFCATGDKVLPSAISSVTVASQPIGFPPSQSTPQSIGGQPVKRNEMNGAFNLYSQTALAFQAGLMPIFDISDPATSIGLTLGYNNGAVLWDEQGKQWLVSTKDANLDNYVTIRAFIGTSWIPVQRYNFDNISNNSPGKRVTIQHVTTDGLTPVLTNAGLDITGDATVANVLNIPTGVPNLGYLAPFIKACQPIGQLLQIDWGDLSQAKLANWVQCTGQTITNCATLFPDYFAYVGLINPSNETGKRGRPYKIGNNVVVPDLTGVFLRSVGSVDLNHESGNTGVLQYDSFQAHLHKQNYTGINLAGDNRYFSGQSGGNDVQYNLFQDISTNLTGAQETRPINIAYAIYTRIAYTI